LKENECIIKTSRGRIIQLIFTGFVFLFVSVLLSAVIYGFILYKDVLLLIPTIVISLIMLLCVGSIFFHPTRVSIDKKENALHCTFIFDKRVLYFKDVLWIKKMWPRMNFKSGRALLLLVIKTKKFKFPRNYCLFRIHGDGHGLLAKNYQTPLDEYIGRGRDVVKAPIKTGVE